MIFVQALIFTYFFVTESNYTITIHKGERIQVEEMNHGTDHNQSKETKIYRGKTSTKSQFLSHLTKTKLMIANDRNHLPSHMVFANKLILQEHTKQHVRMKSSLPLKFKEGMRTRQRSVYKRSKENKAACIIYFDKKSLLQAKEKIVNIKIILHVLCLFRKRPVSKPYGRIQG